MLLCKLDARHSELISESAYFDLGLNPGLHFFSMQ